MLDFLSDIFSFIFTLTCFTSPILIVVAVIIYVKNRKTKKNPITPKINNYANTSYQSIHNSPPTQPDIFLTEEDKDEIDEFYDNNFCPYRPKYLLTKNEWYFYKELKQIADEKHLTVLAKIRMADLVEVNTSEVNTSDKNYWRTYFNKISRKHIDFALALPENLKIVLLIELDDNTHNEKQYERDRFIESVYKKTGYKLLRVHNTKDLKEKIDTLL